MKRKEILDALTGYKCVCGANKNSMQSHCKKCYYSLPEVMRRDLYKQMGSGYEGAYETSIEHLKKVGRVKAKCVK